MNPVVPHVVFLACLFAGTVAEARESIAVEHEASFEGDFVRWETRRYDCDDSGAAPRRVTTLQSLERAGTSLRLDPPLVAGELVQVVTFADSNLVFVPSDGLPSRRTRHGFEVFRPDRASRERVVQCLRARGIQLAPAALLIGTSPDAPMPRLEGRLRPKQEDAPVVLAVSGALLAAFLAGLAVAWRRLVRRVRLEAAEAILKADMPDL